MSFATSFAPARAFLLVSSPTVFGERKIFRSGAFFVEKPVSVTFPSEISQVPLMELLFLVQLPDGFSAEQIESDKNTVIMAVIMDFMVA